MQGLTLEQKQQLLQLARASISKGLDGEIVKINLNDYPPALCVPSASFVTLHVQGELHGCIGSLEAHQALVENVANNAYAAAFRDSRFAPLTRSEFEHLDIHISLLSAPEALQFSSEADLLRQLRPDIDGLILEEGRHRGTFLPSVWEQLPTPRDFLRHLKHKAGLDPDYWSDRIRIQRYTAESIS